eukprot:m.255843 g.255843  ORF g.255843 m.255843 type:complete len:262 (+) comp33950_c0_seq1:109-894(+)
MAVGKNKKLNKSKLKKKTFDPFARKDWYDVKSPGYFAERLVCRTPVNRTQGLKNSTDGLKGRVFDVSLADLNNDESTYRKIKLCAEDVQGKNLLTNFHGMDFTTDKLRSMVKKWHSLIEAFADVKTTDGYVLRIFVIGFTKKQRPQIRKTSYAQSAQIREIRAKMVEIIEREASSCDLRELVIKFIPDAISKDIEKACAGIYPMDNVFIRKVKVLKKPKFDVARLLDLHGDTANAVKADGTAIERTGQPTEFKEIKALDSV